MVLKRREKQKSEWALENGNFNLLQGNQNELNIHLTSKYKIRYTIEVIVLSISKGIPNYIHEYDGSKTIVVGSSNNIS